MFTLFSTIFGFGFTIFFCIFVQAMFYFGYGEPNMITGESYAAWWTMLFFTTWAACVLGGAILDLMTVACKVLRG